MRVCLADIFYILVAGHQDLFVAAKLSSLMAVFVKYFDTLVWVCGTFIVFVQNL